jgi:hypothetical protein
VNPEFQLAFLNKIQRLFAEGDFTASYKYALLIAIADIAVESGRDDDQPLTIPHRRLGESSLNCIGSSSTVQGRWCACIQNNGVQAAVISNIAQFRSQTQASTVNAARSAVGFKSLLTKVTRIVVDKPVFHIQNLGGIRDQFLFESGSDSITLLPGVTYCLRRFQPLVQQLARSQWIDHIKRNKQNTTLLGQDNDLESFLFETSRQSLSLSRPGYARYQANAFTAGLQSPMPTLITSSRTRFTQGTWRITLCWHTKAATAANRTPWRQRHICTAGWSLFNPTQTACHRLGMTQASWLMKALWTQWPGGVRKRSCRWLTRLDQVCAV